MASQPTKIRATSKDGVTEVKLLISHEMETGQRKDADGSAIPAWFVNEMVVRHNDRVVLSGSFGTAVAKNPYLTFRFKGGAAGDRISVSWQDNRGESRSDEAKIA